MHDPTFDLRIRAQKPLIAPAVMFATIWGGGIVMIWSALGSYLAAFSV